DPAAGRAADRGRRAPARPRPPRRGARADQARAEGELSRPPILPGRLSGIAPAADSLSPGRGRRPSADRVPPEPAAAPHAPPRVGWGFIPFIDDRSAGRCGRLLSLTSSKGRHEPRSLLHHDPTRTDPTAQVGPPGRAPRPLAGEGRHAG